ncbi:uncharacterized protein A1O9_03959 [Exophiala aquamarina CBS 119918]|uniref:Uncharacterized protein n=1 Tax=Exophiala aquamarina CBS 119918 TaxID=1182545 RepID=A0A072PU97_9EURO|nr:uncharacterized protein A1O9_03959 [Exophiala aquamarina CBS 119918]KEF59115.1 hypothetical protein A1O9_03959 [Exophiala aquamarina CBS 119918]
MTASGEVDYVPTKQLDYELEIEYSSRNLLNMETLWISKLPLITSLALYCSTTGLVEISSGFGTTISSWIVTLDALEEFKCESQKGVDVTYPPNHLKWKQPEKATFDLDLSVDIDREPFKSSTG